MEWLDVFKFISGGALVWVGNWINRRWQRADKRDERQEERRALRQVQHRAELKQAYAEFIATYTDHLDAGSSAIATVRAYEHARQGLSRAKQEAWGDKTVYERELIKNAERESASFEAIQRFRSALHNVDGKAMNVALIEDDQERRDRLLALVEERVALPSSSTEEQAFLSKLKDREKALNALVRHLGGLFGVNRWFLHTDSDTPKQLSADARPQLAASTDPDPERQ